MKQGRVMRNTEGTIRTVECGNGIYELVKEPDVLEIIPIRSRKNTKMLFTLGTFAIFVGAAAAVIILAPPIGTMLFALIAWMMFGSAASKEGER